MTDNTHAPLRIDDIAEGESKSFIRDEKKYFVVKKKGKIYVYANNCPHLGVPLEWAANQFLDASKSMIQCANHGALFVIESGYCVSGPCSGRKLTSIAFDIVDGAVHLK
jgi:nitrite reductase/ring-hydroxylating ferredoxin subunit